MLCRQSLLSAVPHEKLPLVLLLPLAVPLGETADSSLVTPPLFNMHDLAWHSPVFYLHPLSADHYLLNSLSTLRIESVNLYTIVI